MLKNYLSIFSFSVLNMAITGLAYANGSGGGHGAGRGFGGVIIALGILTFICLLSTFILGFLMPKKRKILFPWHKRLGIAAVIIATIHGMMVLLFH
jgi:hypothetical protein